MFSEAAAASAGGLPSVRSLLRELTAAHLVTEYAPRRYRMHDLVRLYATELAADHGRKPLSRVLDHYLRTAYAAALLLKPRLLPIELPELDDRAVLVPLSSAADAGGFPVHVRQVVWTMTDLFERHGQWRDYIETAHVALSAAIRLRDIAAQARAHRTLSRAHTMLGEYETAREHQERAVSLYAEDGDLLGHVRIAIGQLYVRPRH